jgi:hypothetical protein
MCGMGRGRGAGGENETTLRSRALRGNGKAPPARLFDRRRARLPSISLAKSEGGGAPARRSVSGSAGISARGSGLVLRDRAPSGAPPRRLLTLGPRFSQGRSGWFLLDWRLSALPRRPQRPSRQRAPRGRVLMPGGRGPERPRDGGLRASGAGAAPAGGKGFSLHPAREPSPVLRRRLPFVPPHDAS